MLRKSTQGDQVGAKPKRIVTLARAGTLITVLVVVYHSLLNYIYFGEGDPKRWIGFDLIALFNDSFFMSCMFFISGLFVRDSLVRKGTLAFLRDRGWRLGVPYLISVFVLVVLAYYPGFLRYHWPGTTDFNFFHYWWRMLTVGPWPSGPAWFLWLLLAFDVVIAAIWLVAPRLIEGVGQLIFSARDRPIQAFIIFSLISIASYVPAALVFGEGNWIELGMGRFPISVQISRVAYYATYFFAGVSAGAFSLQAGLLSEDGSMARRWLLWLLLALLFFGALLGFFYARHYWVADFKTPPLWWNAGNSLAVALFSSAMVFAVPAICLRFAKSDWRLLDAMQPSAYGIYLFHYVFIVWLQYAVYEHSFPAIAKFAIVFTGTLSMSWALTVLLRKIPAVGRMI
jgi:peptidoglycan/LPS O-acetylase OafA/YrhL